MKAALNDQSKQGKAIEFYSAILRHEEKKSICMHIPYAKQTNCCLFTNGGRQERDGQNKISVIKLLSYCK